MRQHLTACSFLIGAAVSLATSHGAEALPWCSTRFGLSCGYATFDQCMASIRGDGGNCVQNPRESGSRNAAPDRSRARTREAPKARQAAPREEAPSKRTKPAATTTAAPAAPVKPAPASAPVATVAPVQPAPKPPVATPAVMPSGAQRKPSPADAKVYFVGVQNGAEVPARVTLRFGVASMGVAPAGLDNPNTGHHHLLIDTPLPALDLPIPSDFNHLHFGAGQTEAEITLPPGKHKLQLLFADENHVPHNPPVMSAVIEVVVKANK